MKTKIGKRSFVDRGPAKTIVPAALAIFCLAVVAISLRPGIVSVGPLVPLLQAEFGLSHAAVASLVAIPDFLMGALALPSPWLAHRYGRDRVILLALCLLVGSIAGRAFAGSTTALMLTTSGVGAGIAISGALIAGFVKQNFPAKAGLIFAIYATWIGGGSTISAAMTGPLAELSGSWRPAAGIWAIVAAFAVLAWLVLEKLTPHKTARTGGEERKRIPFDKPTAWLIAIYFACNNFLFYALLSSLVSIYVERGLALTEAGFILASLTGGAMTGSILFGMLSTRADRRPYLIACAVLALAGIVLVGWVPSIWPPVSAVLAALGIGGGFTLSTILPLDHTDNGDEAAAWTALVLTFGYLIAATGPILVGILRDHSGDFFGALWMLVAVTVVKLLAAPFLRPRHPASGE